MPDKFKVLADEIERWPTYWAVTRDGTGHWDGDWQVVNKKGNKDVVESDRDSDYADDLARFIALLVNTAPQMLEHITELESAIRETIPVLERSGRAVLAVKLRKLVSE